MSFLKDHPFAVEAFFENSTVLTFAIPKVHLEKMIPNCLELDLFQDEFAFVAVAMVETKGLRPKGFPKFMGNDFFLIGYRIFVKYIDKRGKRLRGLYIIRSETDKKKMEFFGNIFTHYNYTTTDISTNISDRIKTISSVRSEFNLKIENTEEVIELPKNSPFSDWKEARRFAGPLPFTFTYEEEKRSILIIEGVRQNWTPKPLKVLEQHFKFLDQFPEKILANAFEITKVPYYWKKGRIEKWD